MRIVRIFSLIFVFAALFFGAVQLFFRMRHMPTDLSVGSLLENVAISSDAVIHRLPGTTLQDIAWMVFAAPAWLASLCLAGILWFTANALDDGD